MAKYPKEREHNEGRSVWGDFMNDDHNEFVYDKLIEASEKLEEIIDFLYQFAHREDDGGHSAWAQGWHRAAQSLVEGNIDEEYPPWKEVQERRMNKRLLKAIGNTGK